ncbi:MAG: serine/threonine-protein kinase [Actinomycetota bacterium]
MTPDRTFDGPPPLRRRDLILPGYRVVGHISRGNSLDVYDVWSIERECRCIAKVPRPDKLDETRTLRRLATEGWLLQQLHHPHIVTCYEHLEEPHPALILEMLTGHTLAYLLDEEVEQLTLEETAWLGVHLCSAIGYLHRKGWLHLDVKPANIVSEHGRTKLIDLSIARRPGSASAGIGTRENMSPEQARGGRLTTATDVCGIASVLYECLAGRVVFEGHLGEKGEKLFPQLEMPAPSLGRHYDGPAEVIEVIDRALNEEPSERPTLDELFTGLTKAAGIDPEAPRDTTATLADADA